MPICKYCKKEFTKTHNRQVYCSKTCSKEAKREQDRNSWHKWYHKNKHRLSEKRRWGLGSGELGPHMHHNPTKEYKSIQRELSRLRLR